MASLPELETTEEHEPVETGASEGYETGTKEEESSAFSDYEEEEPAVSSGDVIHSVSEAPFTEALPSVVSVSSGDLLLVEYNNPELMELLQSVQETESLLLESSTRIELQNEAVISILLIMVVVGMLHYIYRFFRLFF